MLDRLKLFILILIFGGGKWKSGVKEMERERS